MGPTPQRILLTCLAAYLLGLTCYLGARRLSPPAVAHVCAPHVEDGVDYSGSALEMLQVADVGACRDACTSLQACVGWTFAQASRSCILSGAGYTARPLDGSISGPVAGELVRARLERPSDAAVGADWQREWEKEVEANIASQDEVLGEDESDGENEERERESLEGEQDDDEVTAEEREQYLDRVDLLGDVRVLFDVGSAEGCESFCEVEPGCVSWSLCKLSLTCVLRLRCAAVAEDETKISGVLNASQLRAQEQQRLRELALETAIAAGEDLDEDAVSDAAARWERDAGGDAAARRKTAGNGSAAASAGGGGSLAAASPEPQPASFESELPGVQWRTWLQSADAAAADQQAAMEGPGLRSCAELCEAKTRCSGWSVLLGTSTCYLKTGASLAAQHNASAVSARRRAPATTNGTLGQPRKGVDGGANASQPRPAATQVANVTQR